MKSIIFIDVRFLVVDTLAESVAKYSWNYRAIRRNKKITLVSFTTWDIWIFSSEKI